MMNNNRVDLGVDVRRGTGSAASSLIRFELHQSVPDRQVPCD
jgi:hypothetical protein